MPVNLQIHFLSTPVSKTAETSKFAVLHHTCLYFALVCMNRLWTVVKNIKQHGECLDCFRPELRHILLLPLDDQLFQDLAAILNKCSSTHYQWRPWNEYACYDFIPLHKAKIVTKNMETDLEAVFDISSACNLTCVFIQYSTEPQNLCEETGNCYVRATICIFQITFVTRTE